MPMPGSNDPTMNVPEPEVLGSAEAEQAWIARCIDSGLDRPRIAFVQYESAAVIYGRSTVPRSEAYDRARDAGCTVLHRRSGGGAVLAGPWMLGAALLVPSASPIGNVGIVSAFRQFGSAWGEALRTLGAACHQPAPTAMVRQNEIASELGVNWVCFSSLSHGELVDSAGCKVLGLAQWRGKWGVLLSAGLLLQPVPWHLLGWVHLGLKQWSLGHAASDGVHVESGAVRQEVVSALRATSLAGGGAW